MSSNIFHTRRGYLYQDRCAVSIYLDHFINKNISEYYVDYPLPKGKSLDIRLIDKIKSEHIFEIKSGKEFQKNNSDIAKSLITFLEYSQNNKTLKMNIVVRKGFHDSLATVWEHITYLQTHSYSTKQSKDYALSLYLEFSSCGFKSEKELYRFCRTFDVNTFPDDVTNGEESFHSEIDGTILQKMDDIASKFGAHACNIEYPLELLLFELLHQCRVYAGTNVNIHNIFKRNIANFITHRIFLDNHYKPKSKRAHTKIKIRELIDKKINAHLCEENVKTIDGSRIIREGKVVL